MNSFHFGALIFTLLVISRNNIEIIISVSRLIKKIPLLTAKSIRKMDDASQISNNCPSKYFQIKLRVAH